MNDQATVYFQAGLKSGGEGAFTRDAQGNLGIIAITSDLIRDFPIGGGINNAGTVSFGADLRDGTQALFTGRGGALSRIADTGPNSPFSSFPPPAATINNDDTVAFRATLKSGGTGVFTGRAGQPPNTLYVTGGQFTAFPTSLIQRNGTEVSFGASLSTGQQGVFRGDGVTTTTIATTGDTYSSFVSRAGNNDAGMVAFVANLTTGGQAVVIGDGTQLITIADTGPNSPFSSFFVNPAVNNDGLVVFTAKLVAGGSGIFISQDGEVDEIIGTGDSLFGSRVTSVPDVPFGPRAFNNLGQLAFAANLADGRTVLGRADPLPCTISLVPSVASPDLVGEPVTWTATATNCGEAPVYQFSVGLSGGPHHVVRDFSPDNHFTWAPMQEGSYDVQVTVKKGFSTTRTHFAVVSYQVDSRVTGSEAVISSTSNPLVALYSVPPATEEGTVFVQFSQAGDNPSWRNTNTVAVVPGETTNIFVAGMLPNTTYQMRHVFSDGTASAPLLFTTGALPSTLTFPTFTVRQAPGPESDLDLDMIYHSLVGDGIPPLATDLMGRVVWYEDAQQSGLLLNTTTILPGGTALGMGVDHYSLRGENNVLREIDLASNTVRETNLDAVNAQLAALGHNPIYGFFLDAQRLPNGSIVTQGLTERVIDVHGTPTNYVGTMILVLDQDFQVTWAWDAFEHLDVNRGPSWARSWSGAARGRRPSSPTSRQSIGCTTTPCDGRPRMET
jgi:hypothetical protein